MKEGRNGRGCPDWQESMLEESYNHREDFGVKEEVDFCTQQKSQGETGCVQQNGLQSLDKTLLQNL